MWLFLQLVDGAFPSGGFAHSQGLEAATHLRGPIDVEAHLVETLWQVGRGTLPFVRAGDLQALDALFDASCTSHVANRASRAQGRAFASTCARIFDAPAIQTINEHARRGPAHHAPIFGAVFAALGLSAHEAQTGFLHGSARGVLSAGVRLGLIGPLEAQRVLADASPLLERIIAECTPIAPEESAQAAPLVELFGALHDRLDGRLFQS